MRGLWARCRIIFMKSTAMNKILPLESTFFTVLKKHSPRRADGVSILIETNGSEKTMEVRSIKHSIRRSVLGLAVFLIWQLLAAGDASAQTLWTDGVGDWFQRGELVARRAESSERDGFDARIDNGGIAKIFAPGASVRRITLGALGGQSGGLQILGGSLDVTQNLHLGEGGQGVVTVGSGGTITSQTTRLGRFTGGSGIATVTGAGSTWSTSLDFLVGESGSGSLSVNSGGAVVVGNNFLVAVSSGAPTSNVTVTARVRRSR